MELLPRFYSVTVKTVHTGRPTGEQLAMARKLLIQPGRFFGAQLDVRGTAIEFICDIEASGEVDAMANAMAWLRQAFAAPGVCWDPDLARTTAEAVRLTDERTMAIVVQARTVPAPIPQMPPQQEYHQHAGAAA